MNKFLASIDRKKLLINAVGYVVIFVLFVSGPPMTGFMGKAIGAYLMIFPAYYLVVLFIKYRARRGDE